VLLADGSRGGQQARIIDIGGGTGGFAVPLAELGHTVQVIDPSPDALAALDRRARERGVSDRVTGQQGDLSDLPRLVDEADLVLCHGVLEMVDDPAASLAAIADVLRPGGHLSLLVAQRHAAVVARAMAGHFQAARELLDGDATTAATGRGGRRYTRDEVVDLLAAAGLQPTAVHAVRVFADLVPGSLLDLEPGASAALVELEQAVATRPEYLPLAAQVHVIARRGPTRRGSAVTDTPLLHVDMDAFYASVATRDRPELRDVPVIVGGGYRGVILAANYAARAYGVRSGMPSTRARRLCPHAVRVSADHEVFSTVSAAVIENFRRITPQVEVVSLDEAFLDVRGSTRRLGSPREIAEQLRATIHDEQGITCSVGVAASISVAKLASRRAKPDGVLVVPPEEITSFLHPLDVGELYGVGEKTQALLHRLGLVTVGDVAHTPLRTLQRAVGDGLGSMLHHLAWGSDSREVSPGRVSVFGHGGDPDKSMGAQETFGRDIDDREVILRELLALTAKVAGRMRVAGVAGRTVSITVRFADFTTITRSRTLAEATDLTQEIYRAAVRLYDALGLQRARLRLVGVRVEGLVPRTAVHRQGVLGEREHGWSDADRAVDRATTRFGSSAVRPASLIDRLVDR
jgi:DNA polymerase-4